MSFPAYPDYKSSGVEWLGDVPVGWGVSRVKFDSYVKARVGWHGLKSDEFTDEGPYLVTGSDFKNKTVDWSSCYHCTDERFEQDEYIQLKENDLLITKDGTIGKLILVEGLPGKATLNSGIFVVRPLYGKYSTKFYFWLLQSSAFFDFVGINKTGSTIVHLYQETFENLPYALPPLVEQLQIARFLDHETARIDALIEEQQRLIELLKEKRQAVISHAVTKGLDPTVPMKDSGVEWLGEVPAHWEVTQVKRRCDLITDGAHISPETESGVYCFVSTRDVSDEGIDFEGCLRTSADSYEYLVRTGCQPEVGDVLFSKDGTIGRTIVVGEDSPDFVVASSLIIIRPSRAELLPAYLDFLCQSWVVSQQVEGFVKGAGLPRLSIQNLTKVVGVFPPLEEQVLIADFLQMQSVTARQLTSEALRTMELLKERRSALISAAVTGKIDVRGWQPSASTQAPQLEVAEAH